MPRQMILFLKGVVLCLSVCVAMTGYPKAAFADKYLMATIYEGAEEEPTYYVRVPLVILNIAGDLLPDHIQEGLIESGVTLEEILDAIEKEDLTGRIIEVHHHRKGQRIVIDIEER